MRGDAVPSTHVQIVGCLVAMPGLALLVLACSGPTKSRAIAVKLPAPARAEGAPAPREVSAGAARGVEAARVAKRYVGVPYVWGGSSPSGFDCSGLVWYAFARVGIALPRRVAEQFQHGTPVPRSQLRPGDLVFFDRLKHNGIYVGDGWFIHAAQTGDVVKVSRLDEGWYRARWVGARRLVNPAH
jgi:cell wall-associated NlpC family hydrolase